MRKIFGTASLHWLSRKSRDKIIDTAMNNGFSQFDTAGVYGLSTTNKYLGSLGLSSKISFSAKLGLKSIETYGLTRIEVLLRKILFPKASRIKEDSCYSNWKRQFENQLQDLRINKVQRLLLHERFITPKLWESFQKFLDEYKDHFDEYGVSANWSTISSSISKIYDQKLLIQTTQEVLADNLLKNHKKLTLYGISKVYNSDINIKFDKKKLDGVIYFSSKKSRIENFHF